MVCCQLPGMYDLVCLGLGVVRVGDSQYNFYICLGFQNLLFGFLLFGSNGYLVLASFEDYKIRIDCTMLFSGKVIHVNEVYVMFLGAFCIISVWLHAGCCVRRFRGEA